VTLPRRDPDAVDAAEQALRDFAGPDLTGHQALMLLEYWAGRDRLVGGQWRVVVARFPGPLQESEQAAPLRTQPGDRVGSGRLSARAAWLDHIPVTIAHGYQHAMADRMRDAGCTLGDALTG
jgi:hypothetical protein